MADYFLDHVDNEEEMRLDFRTGKMSNSEAYENGLIDELGYEPHAYPPKILICKYCKKGNLSWSKVDNKWRLFENGKIHKCSVNPLKSS